MKSATIQVTNQIDFNLKLVITALDNITKKEEKFVNVQINHFPVEDKLERKLNSNTPEEAEAVLLVIDRSGSMQNRVPIIEYDQNTGEPKVTGEKITEKDGILQSKKAVAQIINNPALSIGKKFISGIMFSDKAEVFLNNRPFPTSQLEKNKLIKEIDDNKSFNEGGDTNIEAAFDLIDPEWVKNRKSVKIFFVTDGDAKVDHDKLFKRLAEKLGVKQLHEKCAIYVFGIGTQYNEKTLRPFAEQSRGQLFRIDTMDQIPTFLNTLAENTTAYSPKVYAKRCMIYFQSRVVKVVHFEDLMRGLDKQVHSVSIPREMFTPGASIHLQLTNGQWIVYEDLSLLPDNGSVKDLKQFMIYCGRQLQEVTESKRLSRGNKLNELSLLSYTMKDMLEMSLQQEDKETLCSIFQNVELCIAELDASREGKLSAEVAECTATTGKLGLYSNLKKLQTKILQNPKHQKKPIVITDLEYKWIGNAETFNITHIPIEDFFEPYTNKREFAYSEMIAKSRKDKEDKIDHSPQRLLVGIKVEEVRTSLNMKGDFISLVKSVYDFFGPLDEKQLQKAKKIVESRRKLFPENQTEIPIKYSDFVEQKAATSSVRAMALVMLAADNMIPDNKEDWLKENNIRICKGYSFTGLPHFFVTMRQKDQIFIGDPVYNQFFEIKQNHTGRLEALDFYKKKGLDGILFNFFVANNFIYKMKEVPLMPQLTAEEIEQCYPDSYNLVCAIGATVMRKAVWLFSATKEAKDAKNTNIPEERRGLLSSEAFEHSTIQQYIELQKAKYPFNSNPPIKNPMDNEVLPPDWKIIPADEINQQTWYFITAEVLENRPDAFATPVDENEQKKLIAKRLNDLEKKSTLPISNQSKIVYYIRNNEVVMPSSNTSSTSTISSHFSASSSFSSSCSSNSSSSFSNSNSSSGIFSNFASSFLSHINPPAKLESKYNTLSQIKMFRSLRDEIVLEFPTTADKENFLKECGQTTIPPFYRKPISRDELNCNPEWKMPAYYSNNPNSLYLPYSVISNKWVVPFEKAQVLQNLLRLLALPKDNNPIMGQSGKKIGESYGEDLFQRRISTNGKEVMYFSETSYLRQHNAYVMIDRNAKTMTKHIYVPNTPQSHTRETLSTSLHTTFGSSSSSSTSSLASTSQQNTSSLENSKRNIA